MVERHDARLATSALDMAIQRQRPVPELMIYSDRGSEFANARFHQRANKAQIQPSMSSTGNCYDNAATESFFATVKLDAVRGEVFASRAVARQELFDFIEASTTFSDCIQAVIMPHLSIVLLETLLLHSTGARPLATDAIVYRSVPHHSGGFYATLVRLVLSE